MEKDSMTEEKEQKDEIECISNAYMNSLKTKILTMESN